MDVKNWIKYYESNRGTFDEPDWNTSCQLPADSRLDLLRKSLATFQLGETGEGSTLQRYAKKLAGSRSFTDYDRALKLFVDEEKEHARLLALTLQYLDGPLIEKQWSNSVFRKARRLINLEFEIQIFVTAEIIGKSYYSLLHRHVDDPVLKSVCGKLISDEVKHLNFHIEFFRERLGELAAVRRRLWHIQFATIFHATCQAVWIDHRPCLRAFGVTRKEFAERTSRGMRSFIANLKSERSLVPTVVRPSREKQLSFG